MHVLFQLKWICVSKWFLRSVLILVYSSWEESGVYFLETRFWRREPDLQGTWCLSGAQDGALQRSRQVRFTKTFHDADKQFYLWLHDASHWGCSVGIIRSSLRPNGKKETQARGQYCAYIYTVRMEVAVFAPVASISVWKGYCIQKANIWWAKIWIFEGARMQLKGSPIYIHDLSISLIRSFRIVRL